MSVPIGIGNPNIASGILAFGSILLGAGDIDQVDARTLQILSVETGAKTFIIREVGDGDLLRQAMESISNELREQYTMGPPQP